MPDQESSPSETEDDILPEELIAAASALHNALLEHSLSAVERALSEGAPAWYQNPDPGWGALHYAAEWGDERAVRAVLDAGGVWNAADNLGNTAGDIALSRNDENTYTLIRDAGLRSELLLYLLAGHSAQKVVDTSAVADTDAFLSSHLTFRTDDRGQPICVISATDGEGESFDIGVMMGWERRIMEQTVKRLSIAQSPNSSESKKLRVLNVGFGLGIIDTLFQSLGPHMHTIIEPHPDVVKYMHEQGWLARAGVDIRQSKWQDVLDQDMSEQWDIIYFDTFSEDYEELKNFFSLLPRLLSGPSARFSFFNGLGATNALYYDVSSRLADAHLSRVGVTTEWQDLCVKEDVKDAWGNSRQYFTLDWYKLPICYLTKSRV